MAPSIASISIKLGLQDCMAIYVRQSSIMAHFLHIVNVKPHDFDLSILKMRCRLVTRATGKDQI